MCAFCEAIDPESYLTMKKHFDFITSQKSKFNFAAHKLAEFECHLCQSRIVNKTVIPHKNVMNEGGPVVETCWGASVGGEFCLPEVGVKLPFQRGDFIWMDAAIVMHAVQHVTGHRGAWVQYNKSDATTFKQDIMFMDDGAEKDAVLAKKARVVEAKTEKWSKHAANELKLIKAYKPEMVLEADDEELKLNEEFEPSTEEEHKMFFVATRERQVKTARSPKKTGD